jgi:hypothetical protein
VPLRNVSPSLFRVCLVFVAGMTAAACGSCSSESRRNDAPGDGGPPAADAGDARQDALQDALEADAPQDGGGEDAPSVSDSGLQPGQEWLLDSSAWVTIPGSDLAQPYCSYRRAVEGKTQFPPIVWKPCPSTGSCEEADVVQGYGTFLARPTMSTHRLGSGLDGTPVLQGTHGLKPTGILLSIRRVVQLATGATTDAFSLTQPGSMTFSRCVFGSALESALIICMHAGKAEEDAGSFIMFGFPFIDGRTGSFNLPWLPADNIAFPESFDVDLNGGTHVFQGAGAVYAMLTPGSSALMQVASGTYFVRSAGEGDLALWSQHDGTSSTIMGWSPDGGARTIIEGMSTNTCSVAVSPTHLTGFTGSANSTVCGAYLEPRFWATGRAYQPSQATLSVSPAFSTSTHYVAKLATWGDFVAAHVRDTQDASSVPYLVVARISDWKFRKFRAPVGQWVHDHAFTLTDTHLYLAYAKTAAGEDDKIYTVQRFNLADFDTIGEP